MNKLRVGVIGGGHLGRIHARLLAERPDVLVVGVADPDAEARRQAAEACAAPTFADHRATLGTRRGGHRGRAHPLAPRRHAGSAPSRAARPGRKTAGGQRPRSRRVGRRRPATRRRAASRTRRTVQPGPDRRRAASGRAQVHSGRPGGSVHGPERRYRRRAGSDDSRHRPDTGSGRRARPERGGPRPVAAGPARGRGPCPVRVRKRLHCSAQRLTGSLRSAAARDARLGRRGPGRHRLCRSARAVDYAQRGRAAARVGRGANEPGRTRRPPRPARPGTPPRGRARRAPAQCPGRRAAGFSRLHPQRTRRRASAAMPAAMRWSWPSACWPRSKPIPPEAMLRPGSHIPPCVARTGTPRPSRRAGSPGKARRG